MYHRQSEAARGHAASSPLVVVADRLYQNAISRQNSQFHLRALAQVLSYQNHQARSVGDRAGESLCVWQNQAVAGG